MIPLFVVVKLEGQRRLTLWLPLLLVWLLLLPLVLLLLPFALLATLIAGMRPWRAIAAFWSVLAGTRGMHVEIASPERSVLMHVY